MSMNGYQQLDLVKEKYLLYYLNDIYDATNYFQNTFIGNKVIFKSQHHQITIYATKHNFMHLCGINYSKGAKRFFDDALNRSLSIKNIKIKKDGTTFQKLQVIKLLPELTTREVRITSNGKFLYLHYDAALRTRKQLLALTLINPDHAFIPQSILNLHNKKFLKGEKILAIKSINLKTKKEKIIYHH